LISAFPQQRSLFCHNIRYFCVDAGLYLFATAALLGMKKQLKKTGMKKTATRHEKNMKKAVNWRPRSTGSKSEIRLFSSG